MRIGHCARVVVTVAGALFSLSACGSESGDPGGPASGGRFEGTAAPADQEARACSTDSDCGSGGTCNPATKACACGGISVAAGFSPANVLVVLDRSCSMKDAVVGTTKKWQIAVSALNGLVAENTGKIRFGLELFPDKTGATCAQDAITIPVGDDGGGQMSSLLGAALSTGHPLYPSGPCVTNIDTAMQAAATEPALSDTSRRNFVLLVTDGKQSADCTAGGGDLGTTTAIENLKTAGVDTFVVGFGAGIDGSQLDAWADTGGQARASMSPRYFDAADEASLDAALAAIARRALGCTLALSAPPPGDDVSLVYVFTDGAATPVPRDPTHADRWDYDSSAHTVTFYGAACESLKDGVTTQVSVAFGCPGGAAPAPPVK